jgi:hypothetical protein
MVFEMVEVLEMDVVSMTVVSVVETLWTTSWSSIRYLANN